MVAERVLYPSSKRGTTQLWNGSTLRQELQVADAEVEELSFALDWLLGRQLRNGHRLGHDICGMATSCTTTSPAVHT